LASQIGITDVVYYNMDFMPDKEGLLQAKAKVESFGLRLAVVEGGPPMDKIVLAKEGRDEQIQQYKESIKAMGKCDTKN
jgi:mannonate dehydratase